MEGVQLVERHDVEVALDVGLRAEVARDIQQQAAPPVRGGILDLTAGDCGDGQGVARRLTRGYELPDGLPGVEEPGAGLRMRLDPVLGDGELVPLVPLDARIQAERDDVAAPPLLPGHNPKVRAVVVGAEFVGE